MRKLWTRLPFILIAVITAAVITTAHILFDENWVIIGLYFICLVTASVVSVGYFDGVWDAFKTKRPGILAIYTLGAFLPWVAIIMLCATAIMIRSGYAEFLRSSAVISAYLTFFIIAGILQLSSLGALDGHVPRANLIRVGLALGSGIAAAVLFIALGFGSALIG